MSEIKLNGLPLSDFGATMLKGGYAELIKPAEMKEWISNNIPSQDGVEYMVPKVPSVQERSVSLTFVIVADTEEDFFVNFDSFVKELMRGICTLEVPNLSRIFHLKYESCTSFDNFGLKSCKLAVKFTEPVPRNYAR
jgi:hypothetical protein